MRTFLQWIGISGTLQYERNYHWKKYANLLLEKDIELENCILKGKGVSQKT